MTKVRETLNDGKASKLPEYSDRQKAIKTQKVFKEDERNMARLYEMAMKAKEQKKKERREMRQRFEMDPIMSNVHNRMHMVLMSKS